MTPVGDRHCVALAELSLTTSIVPTTHAIGSFVDTQAAQCDSGARSAEMLLDKMTSVLEKVCAEVTLRARLRDKNDKAAGPPRDANPRGAHHHATAAPAPAPAGAPLTGSLLRHRFARALCRQG